MDEEAEAALHELERNLAELRRATDYLDQAIQELKRSRPRRTT